MSGQGPYNGSYTPEGEIANQVLAELKTGTRVRGTVASFNPSGVWFRVYLDGVGERQVFVRGFIRPYEAKVQWRGVIVQRETLRCVPDPERTGKYKFVVIERGSDAEI